MLHVITQVKSLGPVFNKLSMAQVSPCGFLQIVGTWLYYNQITQINGMISGNEHGLETENGILSYMIHEDTLTIVEIRAIGKKW